MGHCNPDLTIVFREGNFIAETKGPMREVARNRKSKIVYARRASRHSLIPLSNTMLLRVTKIYIILLGEFDNIPSGLCCLRCLVY